MRRGHVTVPVATTATLCSRQGGGWRGGGVPISVTHRRPVVCTHPQRDTLQVVCALAGGGVGGGSATSRHLATCASTKGRLALVMIMAELLI